MILIKDMIEIRKERDLIMNKIDSTDISEPVKTEIIQTTNQKIVWCIPRIIIDNLLNKGMTEEEAINYVKK